MDEEMTREQLEAEIETVKGEIDEVKAKLDNVREQLGEQAVDEKEGGEAGVTPEGELTEEGAAPAEGTGPAEGEDSEDRDLKAQEAELMSELISKQMRLVALEKRLNDIIASEAMENYNEEEEM